MNFMWDSRNLDVVCGYPTKTLSIKAPPPKIKNDMASTIPNPFIGLRLPGRSMHTNPTFSVERERERERKKQQNGALFMAGSHLGVLPAPIADPGKDSTLQVQCEYDLLLNAPALISFRNRTRLRLSWIPFMETKTSST